MESKNPPKVSRCPVLLLTAGFVAGAIVVGAIGSIVAASGGLAGRESFMSANIGHQANIVRDVNVSYMYETDPGTASGSNNLPVESIRFYPGYVVITQSTGHSTLFAVDRLRKFQYVPTKSDE